MNIIPEIDITREQHDLIRVLRNDSFPEYQAPRSYYKQLPHYRYLKYAGDVLVGYMGLDYRVIGIDGAVYNTLGVVEICVKKEYRRSGEGSLMLASLAEYAENRSIDFIILMSDLDEFYIKNGYEKITAHHTWLRLHEFKNYGVAHEEIDEFFVKSISGKVWANGYVDWLGYMF